MNNALPRIRRGQEPEKDEIPLLSLIEQYALHNTIEGKSPRTIDSYTPILQRFARFLRDGQVEPTLSNFNLSTGREYIVHLKGRRKYDGHPITPSQNAPLSPSTIQGHVRTLRAFASWLEDEEYTETNVLARLKLPRVPQKLIIPLTDEEIDLVLACYDPMTAIGCRNRTIIMTILDTGIRLGELLSLQVTDAHLSEGYLKVFGKGSKERVVPIGKLVQRALWQYIERFRPEPFYQEYDQLFLTLDGNPMTQNAVKLVFARLSRMTGIERLHAHLFRHTFAVRFLLHGGDVFSLQQILGHTTLEMVRHYVHLSEANIIGRHRQFSPMDRLSIKGNAGRSRQGGNYRT